MPTVGVQVMADFRRTDLVDRLLDRLNLTDRDVTWDRQRGVWDTRRRATLAAAQRSDWALVLQDDTLTCRDLLPTVERALAAVPAKAIVHLAVLEKRSCGLAEEVLHALARADASGASWVWSRQLLWGVAVAVPSVTVPAMLAWCDRMRGAGDDTRIGQFYARRRWSAYYPRPSLIDHARVPSLLREGDPANSEGRVAVGFIGEDTSGLDLTWTRDAVDLRC